MHRSRVSCLLVVLMSMAALLPAGAQVSPQPAPSPIQDNSFLVEEAYNQEDGVVQHINTFMRLSQSRDWVYTFTEEFPVRGVKNQFSYTLSALHSGGLPGSGSGVGDIAINYRYQLVGDGSSRIAMSPRFTLIAPSGQSQFGRGVGGGGIQTQIPVSVQLNRYLVAHSNIGATWVPRAQSVVGDKAGTHGYNLGQSLIFLARPRFNVLLETVWAGAESVVGPNRTQRSHSLLVNPGVRWAHNFKNGLQIVPGVAVPIGVGPSAGEKGVFVYLSFEHPWNAFKKK